MQKTTGLMTEGNIFKRILFFSIPLLLGNFFQLMYNTIDSIVVGNYVGSTALAAVGASTPIINFMIAFFQGLATGAGVIVSRYYGARNLSKVEKSVHTFIVFSFIFGLFLTITGYLIAPYVLNWMNTPKDTYLQAKAYLQIYFLGNVFVTLYNAGTGILQSVGNAKTPLIILIISSIFNIFFDILFVHVFQFGVQGAALATILCQFISMFSVLCILFIQKKEYQLHFNKLSIDLETLKEIIHIGVPAGLQGMIVSVSNVIVMTYINGFGSSSVAGFSSANKFDNFLGLPVNSFALACTTFISQNLGAKKYDRVKKGVHITLLMSILTVVTLGAFIFLFSDTCISFFSQEPEVIRAGSKCIRVMCPFYFALCFHQVYSSALRASGRSTIPMFTSIIAFVFIRQLFLAVTLPHFHDITVVGLGYSLTWCLAASFTAFYYFKTNWLQQEIQKGDQLC